MTKKWALILILDVFMGLLTGAFALFLSATITALGIESLFLVFVIMLGMTFLFSLAVLNLLISIVETFWNDRRVLTVSAAIYAVSAIAFSIIFILIYL